MITQSENGSEWFSFGAILRARYVQLVQLLFDTANIHLNNGSQSVELMFSLYHSESYSVTGIEV